MDSNLGFNGGTAAGQTIDHLHVHIIPRYLGDVADPRGDVRNVIPARAKYLANPAPTPEEPVLSFRTPVLIDGQALSRGLRLVAEHCRNTFGHNESRGKCVVVHHDPRPSVIAPQQVSLGEMLESRAWVPAAVRSTEFPCAVWPPIQSRAGAARRCGNCGGTNLAERLPTMYMKASR